MVPLTQPLIQLLLHFSEDQQQLKDFLWKNAVPKAAINGLEYIIENLQKRALQIYKEEEDRRPATATASTTLGVPLVSSLSALKNVLEEFEVYANILSIKTKEVRKSLLYEKLLLCLMA